MENKFFRKVDLRSRQSMTDFLCNHFRYDTMSSWNGSTSYANNLKIWKVIPSHLQDKALVLLESEEHFLNINFLISDWCTEQDNEYTAGFNGKGGGYLVMYKCAGKSKIFIGRSIDQNEDFSDFSMVDLKQRVLLVQSFDKLCDSIVQETISILESSEIKEEEYTITKKRLVLV